MSQIALILAAGLGKRMHSSIPKVLHPILGDPCLLWVINALPTTIRDILIVVGHKHELVQESVAEWQAQGLISRNVHFVFQSKQLGTGHALLCAEKKLDSLKADRILIASGDVPLVSRASFTSLFKNSPAIAITNLSDPSGYGRVVSKLTNLDLIVEHRDATPSEKNITTVNVGAYALPWPILKKSLKAMSSKNKQKEYYLPDAINYIARNNKVRLITLSSEECLGMNNRIDQSVIEHTASKAINQYWMMKGVTITNPSSIRIGPRVKLSQDITLNSGVTLLGNTIIRSNVSIGVGTLINDSTISTGTTIKPYSVIESSNLSGNNVVGPFSRLREGTKLGTNVHIGNFVETKKADLRSGVKANHLSYLGDVVIGENTNVGAGVITCNYDGKNKHKTVIGSNAFIGSDVQLIAPVTVSDNALIAAGTTVTSDVPEGHLAISRSPLLTKPLKKRKKRN